MVAGGVVGAIIGAGLFSLLQAIGQIDTVIGILYVLMLGGIGGLMAWESVQSLVAMKTGARPAARKRRHHPLVAALPLRWRFYKSGLYISPLAPLLLGMVTGLFMMLVYTVFDVPYAIFLGAFFAISEILPVVGTWIGFTPGIVVLLFINPLKLLAVMGICYIYQSIKDNLVAPKIVGDIMGLHPVMVILSLLICAKIAGLVGVLFAIPLASMVNVLITYLQEGIRPIEKAG